jgi:hypothetical protein
MDKAWSDGFCTHPVVGNDFALHTDIANAQVMAENW